MKIYQYAFMLFLFIVVGALAMAQNGIDPDSPKAGEVPDETDVVAEFYRLLLQDDPPTLGQEKAIFDLDASGLRTNLIEVQGGDPNEPLLLNLCRQNQNLFVPSNVPEGRISEAIVLSTPFTWSRNLSAKKNTDADPFRFVIATFKDDAKAKDSRMRRIIFTVSEGRIDADMIELDGFDSKDDMVLLTRFLKTPDGEWLVDVPRRE